MPLLAGIFLRHLQLDGFVGFLEAAEKGRNRLARLKVNRPMLDLDDHVVVELAVEGMEDVIGGARPVGFSVAPVEMVVVDERSIENEAAMRSERSRDGIRRVRRGP